MLEISTTGSIYSCFISIGNKITIFQSIKLKRQINAVIIFSPHHKHYHSPDIIYISDYRSSMIKWLLHLKGTRHGNICKNINNILKRQEKI